MGRRRNIPMAPERIARRMRTAAGWLRAVVRDERGDTTMLEGVIVYPIVIFLLFAIMATYSIFYQRWNLQVVATDAAARVGEVYKYARVADLTTGKVPASKLTVTDPYRYYEGSYHSSTGATVLTGEVMMQAYAHEVAESYINRRLRITTYATVVSQPLVDVLIFPDGMARSHIEVDLIDAEYSMPFAAAFAVPGTRMPLVQRYDLEAYSDCLDLSDYLVTTAYVTGMSKKLEGIGVTSTTELRAMKNRAQVMLDTLRNNVDWGRE